MNHQKHPHHHPATFGFRLYRNRTHIWIALAVMIVPVIAVLVFTPLSIHDKQLFLISLGFSSIRLLIAYVVSVVLAVLLAFLCATVLSSFLLPLFDVLQSFPTFAMLPLVVRLLGASETTVTVFLILTIIWPMLFALISAIKLGREDWLEAATVYGARGWRKYLYVLLPISFPGLITGSIVGLGEGWEAVVGGEIIVGLKAHGLGIFFLQGNTSPQLVVFGVLSLLIFIFILNKLIWLPLLERSHKLLSE